MNNWWNGMCRAERPRGCGQAVVEAWARGARPRKSAPGSDCAVRALVAFLLVGVCFGDSAAAQRLWSVEEVAARPVPPIVMDGVAVSAAAVGAPAAEAATVQVAFDYLRLGMGYLELPLPGGSVIEAENAVFEDRGNGNLMWTGEVPGAGYESVVLTVQEGHLVGWFGAPGGPKYVVYAGPDGRGSLAVEVGPTGDWCGVENSPGHDLVRDAAARSHRPATVASGGSEDSLDILVLYPEETEHYWRVIGGRAVGVRQLGDYLNMVFRNGAIKATANLIPARWDPKLPNHPTTQGGHQNSDEQRRWHWDFRLSEEVAALRRRHKPDLIHFIPDVGSFAGAAGTANLRLSLQPGVLTGWSMPQPGTFAHEIGHNLGGRHEPVTFGDRFEEVQSEFFRQYAFGHTDLTSCAKREEYGGVICPRTIMSYGQDLRDDPKRFSTKEPFYSSVRHKPNGWTIGVAGTSEVERVFHETVPVQARSGEAPWRAEQYPRRVIGVRWTDHDTVRVDWSEDWRSQDGGRVDLVLTEGAHDSYLWSWDRWSNPDNPPLDEEWSDSNVTPIVRDGMQVGVEISGLRPGGHYRVSALGAGRSVDGEYIRPLSSDIFHLKPGGRISGSPAAASQVGARVTGSDSVRLYWRDNSRVEDGYEVWYRKWSGEEPDAIWSRYGDPLPASTRHLEVDGLAAEEEIRVTDGYYDSKKPGWVQGARAMRGRYSFVVVAYNDRGWNASETFELEFMPGPHPEPTARGEITDCTTSGRSTGIDLEGYQVSACFETPDGARRRAWDYRLEADQSGLLYFFDRDNAEILVKVLDGCAINGHRWVFVAPVTTLAFRLKILEVGPYLANRRWVWNYDSERRPQDRIRGGVGNPKNRTARTVSDTTAFPCTTAEIAAAKAASADNPSAPGFASLGGPLTASVSPIWSLRAGSTTDCEPGGPTLTLRGGYTVSMCYETHKGEVGDARDWGLDSTQSGLMYFFERNNAEVLIKVLDGCGVNGHRWVFVAPVTDLAFNLVVESPDGQRWTHGNRLGRTADAASDTSAFACSA